VPAIPIFQIDAFTDRPFRGNPAAVCLLDRERDAGWMQAVAAEMNLSETAFVRPLASGFELRWFTPAVEVDLCGHATLAAAQALWTAGAVAAEQPIEFHTRSGVLTASRNGQQIELDFPAILVTACELPAELLEAVGARPIFMGRARFDCFLVVDSAKTVRSLRPDFRRLAETSTRGVIVTAASDDSGFDFVSRFFAPAFGVNEDPVTGSAHCSLAPYWAQQLGKSAMVAFQASSRGGIVHVRINGNRVVLGGQAITVLKGELAADLCR
jgi:PhzF family phenazine biosynthesis protein